MTVQTGIEIVSDWWRRWTRRPRWVAAAGALGALAVVAALALGRSKAESAQAHPSPPVVRHAPDSLVAATTVSQPPAHVESVSATVTPTQPAAIPLPPPLLRVTASRNKR